MPENEYRFERISYIYPTCNNLDRISERFIWSAPSSKAIIDASVEEHEITAIRQQELWTYYSIYFQHACKKHEIFKTGSIIHNLIDESNEAVPYLSSTLRRKTKSIVMKVCFENTAIPDRVSFKVFSVKDPDKEIYSEDLHYDDVIKGFSRTVDFPRQNWRYVITW